MSITTTQRTRRLVLAPSAVATAAVLLLASACGTESDLSQAPSSITAPRPTSTERQSTERQSPADRAECLVNQAKTGIPCPVPTEPADAGQPQYLAPTGRPVPLPGQSG